MTLLVLPFAAEVVLILTNSLTNAVFIVDPYVGYIRGKNIYVLYGIAGAYMVFGTVFLITHKYTLDLAAWLSLTSMYVFNFVAVGFQFFMPRYLIESYATATTLLFVVLFVQRPEKQVDINTGLPGYPTFVEEMTKIRATGQSVQVVMICIKNAEEMMGYLGNKAYYAYVAIIEDKIKSYLKKEGQFAESYFELPGTFYLILEDVKYNPIQAIQEIRDGVRNDGKDIVKVGSRPDSCVVSVMFPESIKTVDELLNFGHSFARFADPDKIFTRSSAITSQKLYRIETHLNEMVTKGIEDGSFSVSFRPLWSFKDSGVHAYMAAPEIHNDEFGVIDGDVLMDAGEERGLISVIANHVMDCAFSYVGRNEDKFADSYMVIKVPVTQVRLMDFTDRVWEMRERYNVHPEQICFAIKETAYENMSSTLGENLKKLELLGYRLALDGFGSGYSNVEKLLELPVEAVIIDRQLTKVSKDEKGTALFKNILQLLRDLSLETIVCGADDAETVEVLRNSGCDIIEGAYCAELVNK